MQWTDSTKRGGKTKATPPGEPATPNRLGSFFSTKRGSKRGPKPILEDEKRYRKLAHAFQALAGFNTTKHLRSEATSQQEV